MELNSVGFTHQGGTREHNEDAWRAWPEAGLWLVVDGMGGHSAGDVASRIICDTVDRDLANNGAAAYDADQLEQSLQNANKAIRDYGARSLNGGTMGATMVALQIRDGRYELLWAGDSRCYRLRSLRLEQLTEDHSQVNDMLRAGVLAPEQARGHPLAHVVTRALGVESHLELERLQGEARAGDLFMLCSDGISDEFADEQLHRFLTNSSLQDANDAILYSALVNKCGDNITCLLVKAETSGYHSGAVREARDPDATIPVRVPPGTSQG
ncbi:PP2C family protein-serine/threonine phosphatase [Halomonadaceae bacterium KBTZ08]